MEQSNLLLMTVYITPLLVLTLVPSENIDLERFSHAGKDLD